MEKKEKKNTKFIYVSPLQLADKLDIGRLAYTMSQEVKAIYVMDVNGRHSIFLLGEFLGDTRMLYYVPEDVTGSYAIYSPKNDNGLESFEIANEPGSYANLGISRIPLIELDSKNFKSKEPKPESILYVKAKRYEDVVNAVISGNINGDSIGMVYKFHYEGKTYIGSFEIITDDKKVFVYAETEDFEGSFYVYDYSRGKISTAKSFSENSYIYVRIINLAAPMPHFKD
ncbi:MAG: hypothetical protein QW814_00480 [Methanothrix sp.]